MKPKFYCSGGAITAEGLKAVADFLKNDVLANQTVLVDALLAREGYSDCLLFCRDDIAHGHGVPEHVFVAESLDDDGNTVFQLEAGEFIQSFHDTEEEARQALRDYEEPREIFEWWLVSDWLADKLCQAGAPVLRNDHGTWWGRTTTGQSLYIDDVIVRIAVQQGVIDAATPEGAV